MKNSKQSKHLEALPLINALIEAHREFQEYLDITTASNLPIGDTDALIEIRQFNISCISKYSNLMARKEHNLLPVRLKTVPHYELINNSNLLWQVNNQLAKFKPVYNKALRSKKLNSLTRMIVAQNNERIIKLQENLIHPISEEGLYVLE